MIDARKVIGVANNIERCNIFYGRNLDQSHRLCESTHSSNRCKASGNKAVILDTGSNFVPGIIILGNKSEVGYF